MVGKRPAALLSSAEWPAEFVHPAAPSALATGEWPAKCLSPCAAASGLEPGRRGAGSHTPPSAGSLAGALCGSLLSAV